MHYPTAASSSESPAPTATPPPQQRVKLEEPSDVETHLRTRLRANWPADIIHNKSDHLTGKTLRELFGTHERAHDNCGEERWHVTGRFGKGRRFGICATFRTTTVISDDNPPEEGATLTNLAVLHWAIADHSSKKYYRFTEVDHRAAVLLSELIAQDELVADPHVTQAVVEQLNRDALVLPDRLLPGPTFARTAELDLQYGASSWKQLPRPGVTEPSSTTDSLPVYELHLEGCTFETGDEDMDAEVKATVDLHIQPRAGPMLDGDRGVISYGDWEDDAFCYAVPNCRLVGGSIRLTRASDDLEIARDLDVKDGSFWMEHAFGKAVPRTRPESHLLRARRQPRLSEGETATNLVERCQLRLLRIPQDTICLTRVLDAKTGATLQQYAVVQSAARKDAFYHTDGVSLEAEPSKQFRSKETGLLYSTGWKVHTPTHGGARLEVTLKANFAEQEFVTTLAQPSFWEGTVWMEGTLHNADGTKEEVVGEGVMWCQGRRQGQESSRLFDMMRNVATVPMEKLDVGKLTSWEAIADGPALSALSTVSVILSMQEITLSDAHKVVLAAMLGVYGYIFHHPGDSEKVNDALEWCQGKWASFFGTAPINYRTLLIRAFMLRELGALLHLKCADWVPAEAVALDIVNPSSHGRPEDQTDLSAGLEFPSQQLLSQPASALELSQLKAVLDGRWVSNAGLTRGSVNSVLLKQGVGVLQRNLVGKTSPTLLLYVDRDKEEVQITTITLVDKTQRVVQLSCQEYEWVCPARGPVRSRACVLAAGRQLYVETHVRGGVERTWYVIQDEGKTLLRHISFYASPNTATPSASCVLGFTIELTNPPPPK